MTISADHPQEGKALLTYLASPAAQETIHATGMRSVAAAAPVSPEGYCSIISFSSSAAT
ncbi:hypothetical protein ACLFLT_25135 [Klebsiella pneumoniae]